MDEIKIGAEQEIYLAPETEKIENADEIAKISLGVEKYPFIIGYDANEKENIITELEKLGCDEIKQLDFANCIAVSMSMAQLKAIKTLVGVEKVEKDYDYKCLNKSMNESEYATYLAGVNPQFNSKKEVKLAVFDTGVTNVSVDGSVNFINNVSTDENGHGTQMAGIISAVVKNAENKVASPSIYSVVTADHRGFAKTSTIMQALDWAINNGIKIVCMSFGDYHKSAFLENMINLASDCGIIMVAAAGNDGGFEDENRIMYPAAFDNVLSVGAKDGDTIANYSSGGENADCFANGSQNTTDINGNAVNVLGTSGATAFVAGTILKNWCIDPEKASMEISRNIKNEMALPKENNQEESLTETQNNDMLLGESVVLADTKIKIGALNEEVSVLCDVDDYYGGYSSDNMYSAIDIPFFYWDEAYIACPGDEIWYKFTTTVGEAHPNGSKGWYGIQTQGSLDTVGYLYDVYGNQIDYDDDDGNNLNFKITKQLDYGQTYYVKVRAYGDNTGSFSFKVDYGRDEHGNTMDTATEIVGVYYQDKSVSGYLHSYGDVDYYTFVSARNCVMEIYTEGDTNTYGQLYCTTGALLDSDDESNGNGNFKITAHLEGGKRYYIAVSHNSFTGYGDYTLRFKFISDWMNAVSGQYNIALWKNTDTPNATSSEYVEISRVFVTEDSASEYYAVIVEDLPSHKPSIGTAIESGVRNQLWSALRDSILDLFIPDYADFASLLLNVGQVIYDNMDPNESAKDAYKTMWNIVRDGGTYIIGKNSQKKNILGNYSNKVEYSAHGPNDIFYGADYQRGNFTIVTLK